MVRSCWAITDNTSMSILLNSSKQHQAPDWAKPEKNRPIILKSNPSEQLNTTHCLASALAKSYTRQEHVFSVIPCPLFLFKGQSQLAHMRIRYHFIANLHITETRFTLFLTKYDKHNNIGWAKAHSKTDFSVNNWKSSKTLQRLKQNCRCTLTSGWSKLFSKWEN